MTLPASLNIEKLSPAFAEYIKGHTEEITAREHERTFGMVEGFLKPGVMLDWGCFAGFDAWRLRQKFGGAVQLHGCDVHPPLFSDFWKEIRMEYRSLHHAYQLPYEDEMFDTILGAGTLEHVPDESASLRELWRVLKPNGRLILTHMPRRYSAIEAVLRLRKEPHHKRRYTRRLVNEKLINHGFIPLFMRGHHSTPMRGPKVLRKVWFGSANLIERSPMAWLTQNLLVAAVKMHGIGGEFFTDLKLNVYGREW